MSDLLYSSYLHVCLAAYLSSCLAPVRSVCLSVTEYDPLAAGGRIEGDVRINGHPKEQDSFARVSGYVEQFDTHSAAATVHEALMFSGILRNEKDIDRDTTEAFVDQVWAWLGLSRLSCFVACTALHCCWALSTLSSAVSPLLFFPCLVPCPYVVVQQPKKFLFVHISAVSSPVFCPS